MARSARSIRFRGAFCFRLCENFRSESVWQPTQTLSAKGNKQLISAILACPGYTVACWTSQTRLVSVTRPTLNEKKSQRRKQNAPLRRILRAERATGILAIVYHPSYLSRALCCALDAMLLGVSGNDILIYPVLRYSVISRNSTSFVSNSLILCHGRHVPSFILRLTICSPFLWAFRKIETIPDSLLLI